MELQKYCENRLRHVLIKDKQENPNKIINILKSELLYVLKNYMEIDAEDLTVNISVSDKGRYHIELEAFVKRLKMVKYIVD